VKIPLSSLFPPPTGSPPPSLVVLDVSYTPPLHIPLKLGDVNLDGFPDILAIVAPSGSRSPDRIPKLAVSTPCGNGIPGCGQYGSGSRGWEVLTGEESLDSVHDARSVAFLDMDEDVSRSVGC